MVENSKLDEIMDKVLKNTPMTSGSVNEKIILNKITKELYCVLDENDTEDTIKGYTEYIIDRLDELKEIRKAIDIQDKYLTVTDAVRRTTILDEIAYNIVTGNWVRLENNEIVSREELENHLSKLKMDMIKTKKEIVWASNDHYRDYTNAMKLFSTKIDPIFEVLLNCQNSYLGSISEDSILRRKIEEGIYEDNQNAKYLDKVVENYKKETIFDHFYRNLPLRKDNNQKEFLKSWFLSTISVNFNKSDSIIPTMGGVHTRKKEYIDWYNENTRQLESVLIITGDKNMRKTSLIRSLLSGLDSNGSYYNTKHIDFTEFNDDTSRVLARSGIIFNDELAPINTEEKERNFKNFVSITTLTHRPLYSETLETRTRRAGFISTTNDRLLLHGEASRKRAVILEFIDPVSSDFLNFLADVEYGSKYVKILWGYFVNLYLEEYKDTDNQVISRDIQVKLEQFNEQYEVADAIATYIQDNIVKKSMLKTLVEDRDYYYIKGSTVTEVMTQIYDRIQKANPGSKKEYIDRSFRAIISKESEWSYLRRDDKVGGRIYKVPFIKRGFDRDDPEVVKLDAFLGCNYSTFLQFKTKQELFQTIADHFGLKVEEVEIDFEHNSGLRDTIKRTCTRKDGKPVHIYKIGYNKENYDKFKPNKA